MSVFEALKGKINTVQQDISSSFKSIRATSKSKRLKKSAKTGDVDLDAGADLLHRFSEKWIEIAKDSEGNAKKAELVDKQIGELFKECQRQSEAMNQLHSLVSSLPDLTLQINTAMDRLGLVSGDLSEVEHLLVDLEDVCEQRELRQNQLHHQSQLSLYQQRKNVDLEQLKVNLAREHSQKVQSYETKMKLLLKERQKAFDQAFNKELEHYKLFGQMQAKPSTTSSGATSSQTNLGDVSLDEDSAALDDFLKNVDQSQDGTESERVLSSETDEGEDAGISGKKDADPEPDSDINAAVGEDGEPNDTTDDDSALKTKDNSVIKDSKSETLDENINSEKTKHENISTEQSALSGENED